MKKRQGKEKGYWESLVITQSKAKVRQRSERQGFCEGEAEYEGKARKGQGRR